GWFEYLSGNGAAAVKLLANAAARQNGQPRAMTLFYRGAILNRLGQYEEALMSLNGALTERDDLILAVEEKGESLWQLGRKDEAMVVWKDALQRNPRLVLANNELAGASSLLGRSQDMTAYERQADQSTPPDPLYHWTIGLRLQGLGMDEMAEKHFQTAIQLNPEFQELRQH
ncbi:MAG TPA: hypothetical protein VIV66_19010, partial [Pyrinomonadaceae bacterium]